MFGKKKKTLGFQPKPMREKAQIEREYGDHSVQAGHKQRMIKELNIEIDHHIQQMMMLNREGMEVAKHLEKAKAETAAATQDPPAEEGNGPK